MIADERRRRVARLVLARIGDVGRDPEQALARVVERRREGLAHRDRRVARRTARAGLPGSRSRPTAASVALVSTTVLRLLEQQLPQHRRQVERHRGQLDLAAALAAPLDPAHHGLAARPPAASVCTEPVRHDLEPPQHGAQLLQQLAAAARTRPPAPAGPRSSPPRRAAPGRRAASASSSADKPVRPDRIGGEVVVQPPLAAWRLVRAGPRSRANSWSDARRASASAGTQPVAQQVEARARQQVVAGAQLVEERRDEAAPVPLEPAEQPAHAPAGHLRAEVPGGHVLEVMRLVEHEPLVRRQHRRFLPVVAAPAAPRGRRRAGGG